MKSAIRFELILKTFTHAFGILTSRQQGNSYCTRDCKEILRNDKRRERIR